MKRSEMLKALQHWYETDEFDDEHTAKINAHRVLELLEHLGMKPPYSPTAYQKLIRIYIDPDANVWDDEQD